MTVNGTAFVFASRIPNIRFVPARNTTAEMESVLTCPSSHRVSHYSRHNSSKTGSVQLQIILRAGTEHIIEGEIYVALYESFRNCLCSRVCTWHIRSLVANCNRADHWNRHRSNRRRHSRCAHHGNECRNPNGIQRTNE